MQVISENVNHHVVWIPTNQLLTTQTTNTKNSWGRERWRLEQSFATHHDFAPHLNVTLTMQNLVKSAVFPSPPSDILVGTNAPNNSHA